MYIICVISRYINVNTCVQTAKSVSSEQDYLGMEYKLYKPLKKSGESGQPWNLV